jgi:hypothetical protein
MGNKEAAKNKKVGACDRKPDMRLHKAKRYKLVLPIFGCGSVAKKIGPPGETSIADEIDSLKALYLEKGEKHGLSRNEIETINRRLEFGNRAYADELDKDLSLREKWEAFKQHAEEYEKHFDEKLISERREGIIREINSLIELYQKQGGRHGLSQDYIDAIVADLEYTITTIKGEEPGANMKENSARYGLEVGRKDGGIRKVAKAQADYLREFGELPDRKKLVEEKGPIWAFLNQKALRIAYPKQRNSSPALAQQ